MAAIFLGVWPESVNKYIACSLSINALCFVVAEMSTTRARVPSEIAHECLEGVLVRALESDAPVPEVVLPDNCTAARVVQVLQPAQGPACLSPGRVPEVVKALDNVRHVDTKPKRRPSKRKVSAREGGTKGHDKGGVPGGGGCESVLMGRFWC